MSNDKALTSFQAQVAQQKQQMAERLTGLGGESVGRIKIKKPFFLMPDETDPDTPHKVRDQVDLVILDWAYSYNYYESAYTEGAEKHDPPVCFSVGKFQRELEPSDNSPQPQHSECQTCPHNQFGSRGKGKACQNRVQIACRWYADNGEESNIMVVSISPTSLKHWAKYVRKISEGGYVPAQLVTTMYYNPDSAYAQTMFTANRDATRALNKNKELHARYTRDIAEAERILLTPPNPNKGDE